MFRFVDRQAQLGKFQSETENNCMTALLTVSLNDNGEQHFT